MGKHSLSRLLRSWTSALLGTSALLMPIASQAETILEYVGPLLKRFGGEFDLPAEVTSVRVVIVLHDGVKTRGTSLAGHSRASQEGKIFKHAEITVGRNTYKFQLPDGNSGDLNLTFDAAGNVADWQIRYFGHFDDIALYGPGSVRPRGSPNEPDVPQRNQCLHADVVSSRDRVIRSSGEPSRSYRAIGCGVGKWSGDGAGAGFSLLAATTSDSTSVDLIYRLNIERPEDVKVDVYRADSPSRQGRWVHLGSVVLSASELRAGQPLRGQDAGASQRMRLTVLRGTKLVMNPELPFVVVDATTSLDVRSVSFKKRSMAVLAHGFTFDYKESMVAALELLLGDSYVSAFKEFTKNDPNAPENWEQVKVPLHLQPTALQVKLLEEVWAGYDGATLVHPWVGRMANSLSERRCYERVEQLDWAVPSTRPTLRNTTNAAVMAHARMRTAELEALGEGSEGSGDVVDWTLIGHSRGAVVLSELLKLLKEDSSWSRGGLIKVTLLDAHPASNSWHSDISYDPGWAISAATYVSYSRFQEAARDPPIELPGSTGIDQVEVWYQHATWQDVTPLWAAYLDRSNLWGQTEQQFKIDPSIAKAVAVRDITGASYADDADCRIDAKVGRVCPYPAPVGHSTVPDYYRVTMIDSVPPLSCPSRKRPIAR
jgi:hypothetical protein